MWSALVNALAGLNLCHDVGYMNSGLIVSLESLLFADEIISAVSHFVNGIEVDEETLALDVIEKVGPEGNFLSEEHTIRFLEGETWHSQILNRKHFRSIEAKGGKTINQKLEEKAHRIIEEDTLPLVSDDKMKELDKIIAEREKKLA
jgi:trimethylamine--corrinoid protein Co-methyltransferase